MAVLAALAGLTCCPVPAAAQEAPRPERGLFLVATEQMQDPRFRETVVLLVSNDRTGTAGVIVNRPSTRKLTTLFPGMRKPGPGKDRLYFGGPVGTRQLVMLRRTSRGGRDWARVLEGVSIATSSAAQQKAMKKLAADDDFRVYAGYAGWVRGQLDWELRRGDWYLVAGDAGTVFNRDASKVWRSMLRKGKEILVRAHGGSGGRRMRLSEAGQRLSGGTGTSAVLLRAGRFSERTTRRSREEIPLPAQRPCSGPRRASLRSPPSDGDAPGYCSGARNRPSGPLALCS